MSTTYYPPMVTSPYAMGEFDPGGMYWTVKNGVAIPATASVLSVFKELQRQINRILVHYGKKAIGVDGRLGPGTIAGITTALNLARGEGHAPPLDISQYIVRNLALPVTVLARYAGEVAAQTSQIAARLRANPVPDPPQSQPSQPAAGGGVVHPPPAVIAASASPSIIDSLGVPRPVAYMALAVGALAIYKATKAKGRRGRR